MPYEEKRLVIMLAQTKLDLDQITATMLMVKENKHGIDLLTQYLNEMNEHNPQTIMKKAKEIMQQ